VILLHGAPHRRNHVRQIVRLANQLVLFGTRPDVARGSARIRGRDYPGALRVGLLQVAAKRRGPFVRRRDVVDDGVGLVLAQERQRPFQASLELAQRSIV
jgi:hypothetical protein